MGDVGLDLLRESGVYDLQARKYSFDYIRRGDKLVRYDGEVCFGRYRNQEGIDSPFDACFFDNILPRRITGCLGSSCKGDRMSFIEEREYGGGSMYYRVIAENDHPVIHVDVYAAEKQSELCENTMTFRHGSFFCSFIAEFSKEKEGFVVSTICEGNDRNGLPFVRGECLRVSECEDKFRLRLISAMELCFEKGITLSYYDFIISGELIRPVLLSIRSVNMDGRNMLLAEIHHIHRDAESTKSYIMADVFGDFSAAALELMKNGEYCLVGMDESMEKLIVREGLRTEKLISSAVCSAAAENMLSASGEFAFRCEQNGVCRRFIQTCVPIIKNDGIRGMLISLIRINMSCPEKTESLKKLTPRERDVIDLVAEGLTNRYIARNLRISEGTVKKNLYNCYRKLEVSSRTEVVKMMKKGIL